MSKKDFDKIKNPVVHINKSLDRYDGKVMNQAKLDKANEMLRTIGLPKTKAQK